MAGRDSRKKNDKTSLNGGEALKYLMSQRPNKRVAIGGSSIVRKDKEKEERGKAAVALPRKLNKGKSGGSDRVREESDLTLPTLKKPRVDSLEVQVLERPPEGRFQNVTVSVGISLYKEMKAALEGLAGVVLED